MIPRIFGPSIRRIRANTAESEMRFLSTLIARFCEVYGQAKAHIPWLLESLALHYTMMQFLIILTRDVTFSRILSIARIRSRTSRYATFVVLSIAFSWFSRDVTKILKSKPGGLQNFYLLSHRELREPGGGPSWVEYRSGGSGDPHHGMDIFPDLSPRAKPYCGVNCSQGLHFPATTIYYKAGRETCYRNIQRHNEIQIIIIVQTDTNTSQSSKDDVLRDT